MATTISGFYIDGPRRPDSRRPNPTPRIIMRHIDIPRAWSQHHAHDHQYVFHVDKNASHLFAPEDNHGTSTDVMVVMVMVSGGAGQKARR